MAIIEIEELRKSYGSTIAVDGLSLTVDAGEIFGILGANGAGKTTAAECIAGLTRPDAGRIRVAGIDPHTQHAALTRVLGVQLQESGLPDKIRVAEAIELFAGFHEQPADAGSLMRDLGLDPLRDRYYGKLSGGQKQRLSIALALIGNPKVAILDELTTGLDPAARRDTWRLIDQVRERGVTILLITHFMEEAEHLCDRVAIIAHGRLAALDTPKNLAAASGAAHRIRFRPTPPIEPERLRGCAGVRSAQRAGDEIEVLGEDGALQSVMSELTAMGVRAHAVRVDQSTLDDAFLSITGGQVTHDDEEVLT